MNDLIKRLRRPLVPGLTHPMDAERREAAAEIEQLRAEVGHWNADARRLAGGLMAIHGAGDHVPAAVLRGVAYDVCLNCMEPDTARYQIERRALEQARKE